jgi:hypothetical protein
MNEAFYGENSPMLALKTMQGRATLECPAFVQHFEPYDILHMVVGNKKGFKPYMLSYSIKQWFKNIDLYMDVPILGLFSESFDIDVNNWWLKLVKCPGYIKFLNNFTHVVKDSGSLIMSLSHHGYMDCIKWLVKQQPCEIYKVFRIACAGGHVNIAKWCIDTDENPLVDIHRLFYGFICACENGHLEIAKLCIEHGVTGVINFNTGLHHACAFSNIDISNHLISIGATSCGYTGGYIGCKHKPTPTLL